ncbi:MAG: hypothetical protein JKY42_02625 [Flavobacteriales bacterium]|nr:hypothetical protein [Flavobacteriales bacterium]
MNEIEVLGLKNNLNSYPFVEHKESVRRMQRSCMLLFIVPQTAKNDLILTGKLFEYLASGTPLLSIGPLDGNAAKIIKDCGRGDMVDYDNNTQLKQTILDSFNSWIDTDKECPQLTINEEIQNYSRQLQTKKLVSCIDQLI